MACQYSLLYQTTILPFKARGLRLNLIQLERHFRANVKTRPLPLITLITSLLSPLPSLTF